MSAWFSFRSVVIGCSSPRTTCDRVSASASRSCCQKPVATAAAMNEATKQIIIDLLFIRGPYSLSPNGAAHAVCGILYRAAIVAPHRPDPCPVCTCESARSCAQPALSTSTGRSSPDKSAGVRLAPFQTPDSVKKGSNRLGGYPPPHPPKKSKKKKNKSSPKH